MHYLIFLLFVIVSSLALKLCLNKRLTGFKSGHELTEARQAILLKEHLKLKDINEALSRNVQNLIEFY